MAGRIAGSSRRTGPAALGVAAGLVLGLLASLAGVGSGAAGGLDHPALVAVSAALGVGATALSAGLAQLGTDALPCLHRRVAMAAIVVIDGLVFASALWIGSTLQFVLDSSGLPLARAWLVTLLPSASLVTGTVAVLALSAGWALWARTGRAAAAEKLNFIRTSRADSSRIRFSELSFDRDFQCHCGCGGCPVRSG